MTPPIPTIDQAVQAVTAAEATFNADTANVTNIETAISTATAPLGAAQAQVVVDVTNYVTALNNLVAAAQAEIASIQPTPTPPASA